MRSADCFVRLGLRVVTCLLALFLFGCNTLHGVGTDLSEGGQAIARAASSKHNSKNSKASIREKQKGSPASAR